MGILFSGYRKNGKIQKRGKINLIGKLQLSTEKAKEEDNEGIVQLRILRVQVSGRQLRSPHVMTMKLVLMLSGLQY